MAVNVLTVSPFIRSGDTQSKRVGQLVDFTTSRVLTPTYCSAADHAVQSWMVESQAGKEMQFACSKSCDWLCVIYSYLFVPVRHYLTPLSLSGCPPVMEKWFVGFQENLSCSQIFLPPSPMHYRDSLLYIQSIIHKVLILQLRRFQV